MVTIGFKAITSVLSLEPTGVKLSFSYVLNFGFCISGTTALALPYAVGSIARHYVNTSAHVMSGILEGKWSWDNYWPLSDLTNIDW